MPADGQERQAGDGPFSMSTDVQRQDRRKRRWIMQHAGRWTEAGQEMDHAACRQMDRGRAAEGSYSIPANEQGQGSRWIIQHAGRWTGAGQQRDHTAFRQMNRGRAADGSYSMPADEQGRAADSSGCRWTD